MIVDWLPRTRRPRGLLLALCVDLALWALIVGAAALGVFAARNLFGA